MKRIVILTLTMLLVSVCLIGCANHPSAGSQTSDTENQATVSDTVNSEIAETNAATESSYTQSEETTDNTNIVEGTEPNDHYNAYLWYYHKLDVSKINYPYKFYLEFSGVDTNFNHPYGTVDEEYDEWLEERFNYTGTVEEPNDVMVCTVLHLVRDFNVPKEEFERVNEKVYPLYGPTYTQQEIDALYSDDIADFYREFKNPCAILVGDKVYLPQMLEDLTMEELKELGITEDIIGEYMNGEWGVCAYGTVFYTKMMELCDNNNIEYTVSDNYLEMVERGIEPIDLKNTEVHMAYEDDYEQYFPYHSEE